MTVGGDRLDLIKMFVLPCSRYHRRKLLPAAPYGAQTVLATADLKEFLPLLDHASFSIRRVHRKYIPQRDL
jgi:hypothetical protein